MDILNTERIELKNKTIRCSPVEASSIFKKYKASGKDVAWYTMTPTLSLVRAFVHGRDIEYL